MNAFLSALAFEAYWPLIFLPLPIFIYRWLPAAPNQSAALRVPFLTDLQAIEDLNSIQRQSTFTLVALSVLWIALLIAACRPILIGEAIKVPTEARDLLLAVDISGSMDERDMQLNNRAVTRIQIVKHVLSDFINRRQGDRIGLILFADNAYIQAPLTYDTKTVRQLMLEAQLGFAGQKTAIGDAIGLSVKRLIERPNDSRTVILLTDGANNAGSVEPLDATAIARENNVKIHTIGIGAGITRQQSFFGSSITRNPSRSLDEKTLRDIANQTGGQYFRAKDSKELTAIYAELDKLEPVDQDSQYYRPKKQIFFWPMALALIITATIVLNTLIRRHLGVTFDNTEN